MTKKFGMTMNSPVLSSEWASEAHSDLRGIWSTCVIVTSPRSSRWRFEAQGFSVCNPSGVQHHKLAPSWIVGWVGVTESVPA